MPLTICKTQAHKLKSPSNSIHVENCYFNSGKLAGLVHYRGRDSQANPSGAFLISVSWKRVELSKSHLQRKVINIIFCISESFKNFFCAFIAGRGEMSCL